MSYGFDLPRARADVASEEQRRRLAERLIEADPSLTIFVFDHDEIARSLRISQDEARRRFSHIELNGPDDGDGIQVTILDRGASVTVPFCHSGPRATRVLERAWTYLRLLAADGMKVHDGQLGRTIDLDRDFDAVARAYAGGVGYVRRVADR